MRHPAPRLATLAFVACVLGAGAAHAKAFSVPCDGAALAEAMETAGFNGQEDVIWLARDCVYALPTILIAYPDQGFPLTIRGGGATVSGQNQRTAFLVNAEAALSLEDVTVTQGRAGAGATGDGGAFYVAGSLTLTRSTVSDSEAAKGGGIYIAEGGSVTLLESTVSGNRAGSSGGGGILNHGGRLTVLSSTISGNVATGTSGEGAGIYVDGRGVIRATATLANCTISGNASRFGAGLYNDEGNVFVSHCTIARNTIVGGGNGGSIYHRNYSGKGSLKLGNSILADSIVEVTSGYECVRDPSLPTNQITPSGTVLIEDASCAVPTAWNGDPKLGPLTGSPAVHPLLPGSPMIDFGEPARCTGRDQRGVMRPTDGDGNGKAVCDVGAVEAP